MFYRKNIIGIVKLKTKSEVLTMENKTNVKKAFKERFSALRKESGLSQAKLGEQLNLSPATIGYYENGDRIPDIEIATRIAEYFNVTIDYLTGRNGAKSIDKDMQTSCEVTGLSEMAIKNINKYCPGKLLLICNAILESNKFYDLLRDMYRLKNAVELKSAFDKSRYRKIESKLGKVRAVESEAKYDHNILEKAANELFPIGYDVQSFKNVILSYKFNLECDFRYFYECLTKELVDINEIERKIKKYDYDIDKYYDISEIKLNKSYIEKKIANKMSINMSKEIRKLKRELKENKEDTNNAEHNTPKE